MTDGWLMEADCVHGRTWYECPACDELDEADEQHATGTDVAAAHEANPEEQA